MTTYAEPKTFTFCTLGDSLSHCISGRGWQERVRAELRHGSTQAVRNINIAEAGTTVLEWGIPNVALVARLRCDVVLMEFCTNDFQRLTLAEADTYTTTVINTIKAARSDVHIFLMTMNPIFVTAGNGMPAGNPAKLVTQHQQYRTIAARENVGLIDNEPLWAGYVNETIIPDGVHPLETGTNAVLVPSVISALRPLLLTSS